MATRTRTKGFTLIDLLVAIMCVAILVTIPACMLLGARRQADAAACRANLSGIGKANAMFMGEDRNARFPLLFTAGQPEANIEAAHASGDIEELRTKLVGSEAAMQNVWILIDKGLVPEDAFGCPADRDYVPREWTDKADRRARKVGWWSSAQFSYGLHFPYKSTTVDGEVVKNPAYIGPILKGSFVIMADKNPSQNNEPATGVGADKGLSNHGSFGEAYLMFGGAVNWKQGAKDSNVNGDDIYTIQTRNNANPATPADIDDQYIVRHPALPKE
ncbi:MAG: hypothetical protein QGH60_15755 [Phycisphaerae bacterium]|jgi:type II secretory pathway pseudopilin PulG|nr:hypothetical protein [Phycisphaerae bacterium]